MCRRAYTLKRSDVPMSYMQSDKQPSTSVSLPDARTMKVYGNGKVAVKPNVAIVQLGVVTENKSLHKAQQENTEKMNKVLQTLVNLGIPNKDIQTSAFIINPKYDYQNGKQFNQRYQVMHMLQVRLTHIDQVGIVIDTVVNQGVNRITDIRFTTDQTDILYENALQSALQDAKRKSYIIANTLKLPLSPMPIRIVERTINPPAIYKTAAATTEGFATHIQPGQIEIEAAVELVYSY